MNPNLVKVKEGSTKKAFCDFCHKNELNETEWGEMFKLNEFTVHYFCMLFSSGLCQTGQDTDGIQGFMPDDLRKELRRGEKLKCKYCKGNRATVGCVVKTCKSSFHFTCGLPRGTLHQFADNFVSYCPLHKPDVNKYISVTSFNCSESECSICYSAVTANEPVVWPPCCKKRVFHRLCMQKYARNAGSHHFSCPACKCKEPFVEVMQKSGVYVPEQDATWEAERNFADLEQQYSHCDAEDCLCPKGREYNGADKQNKNKKDFKNWRIVRCSACGAKATHYSCSQLEKISWKCTDCVTVLERAPTLYETDKSSSGSSSSSCEDEDEEEFNETNESCRVIIAGRSSLVGVERTANELSNPVDYISQPRMEEVAADKAKIIYHKRFRKKYKMVVEDGISESEDEEETPMFTRPDTRPDISGILSNSNSSVNTNSVGNAQVQPADSSYSSQNHIKTMLKVKNLDLSEHKSQIMAVTCSFPKLSQIEIETETESKSREDVSSIVSESIKSNVSQEHTEQEVTNKPASSSESGRSTRSMSKLSLSSQPISLKSADKGGSDIARNNDSVPLTLHESEVIGLVKDKFKEKFEELFDKKKSDVGNRSVTGDPDVDIAIDLDRESTSIDSASDEVELLKIKKSPIKIIAEVIDIESGSTSRKPLNVNPSVIHTVTLDDDDDEDIFVEKEVPSEVTVLHKSSWKPSVVKSSALMDILNGDSKSGRGFRFRGGITRKGKSTDEVVTLSDDEGNFTVLSKTVGTSNRSAGLGLSKPSDSVICLSDDEGSVITTQKSGRAQDDPGNSTGDDEPRSKKSNLGKSSSSRDFGTFRNSSKSKKRLSQERGSRDSENSSSSHKEEFTISVQRPKN